MITDFISDYANYADVLECPRTVHESVAIQIVASLLNRSGVTISNGAIKLSFDLWMVLLSGSGGGRNTTLGMIHRVLDTAGLSSLNGSSRWGSGAALFQHFAERPVSLEVWPEMAERLKLFNESGFVTTREWWTDRYDNFSIPAPITYRDKGKNSDTPPITFDRAPRINVLATSAEAWFFNNLQESDSMGGFLPRWLPVRLENTRRDIPVPKRPDPALVAPLAERLKQIAALSGEANLEDVQPEYEAWYSQTKTRFMKHPNLALSDAFWNRHRNHILKLATVFSASSSATLDVDSTAWERAVEFMGCVEKTIFRLLESGVSAQGFQLSRIEEKIRQAGQDGITHSDLIRCFQSMNSKDRTDAILTLFEAGRIIRKPIPPTRQGGRPGALYVHLDFS